VRSAEGVELHMPIAGPSPRMLAYAIDAIFVWCGLALTLLVAFVLVPALAAWARDLLPAVRAEDVQRNPQTWFLPFLILFVLLGYFGELLYFVFWEGISGGSSPGKRLVGLRVVRLDGLKVDMQASLIRNLMRAADMLPSSYVVGLTSMLISSHGQRLGDLAAGTFVVRLDAPERAVHLSMPPDLAPLALSRQQLEKLGSRERALVRGTLRRAQGMQGERREALLRTAAQALCSSLELEPSLAEDPELLLRRLWLTIERAGDRSEAKRASW
jgi:uncharacterized RDD family membrane protein YckC